MGKILIECWKNDVWLKVLTIVSILLLVLAFFIPPMAVIDGSILAAVGELIGIGALWELNEAIDNHLNAKVKIKEIELEIKQQEKENKDDELETLHD